GVPGAHQVIVAGDALPRARRGRRARPQVLATDRLRRKVLVAFDDDALVALGKDGAVPRRSRHGSPPSTRARGGGGRSRTRPRHSGSGRLAPSGSRRTRPPRPAPTY